MQHDPRASMLDILLAIEQVLRFMRGKSLEDLESDEQLQMAVFGSAVILGEAANRVPPEVRSTHSDIHWRKMVDFRNRMAHGYDSIDWAIVHSIIRDELPTVETALREIVPKEANNE